MQTEVQSSLPDLPSKKLQKSRRFSISLELHPLVLYRVGALFVCSHRSTVKELARLQPKSVFGLEEMLDELKTYRRSLRACEQVTMLRIPMQRLRSAIEKYHPEVGHLFTNGLVSWFLSVVYVLFTVVCLHSFTSVDVGIYWFDGETARGLS